MVLLVGGDSRRRVFEDLSFYKGTILVRYDDTAHQYFRVSGNDLILLDGATTVVHVVDKSQALIGWAVKKGAEKLLRIVPRRETPSGRIMLPEMPFADFEVLVNDAKGAHKEHLSDAANVGKQAHYYLESMAKLQLGLISELPPIPKDPRAIRCIIDALETWEAHNLVWRAAERKVSRLSCVMPMAALQQTLIPPSSLHM